MFDVTNTTHPCEKRGGVSIFPNLVFSREAVCFFLPPAFGGVLWFLSLALGVAPRVKHPRSRALAFAEASRSTLALMGALEVRILGGSWRLLVYPLVSSLT